MSWKNDFWKTTLYIECQLNNVSMMSLLLILKAYSVRLGQSLTGCLLSADKTHLKNIIVQLKIINGIKSAYTPSCRQHWKSFTQVKLHCVDAEKRYDGQISGHSWVLEMKISSAHGQRRFTNSLSWLLSLWPTLSPSMFSLQVFSLFYFWHKNAVCVRTNLFVAPLLSRFSKCETTDVTACKSFSPKMNYMNTNSNRDYELASGCINVEVQ